MLDVITDNLDVWTTAQKQKKAVGRGKAKKDETYGVKKLRELILELAVRGKLVTQDPKDEPASILLEKIAEEKQRLIDEGKIKMQKALPEIEENEKTNNLPSNWVWVRFGAIAQHNSGKTLDKRRNSGISRKYLTTSNLYWGKFKLDVVREMLIKDDELEKCLAKKNDLLICEGGEAGRAAVWPYEENICIQNHVHRARFYCDVNPYYGFRFFEKISLSGEIDKHRKGVGISNMSGKALSMIVFPLPPLAEQHRIVAKVDELMALCDQLEQEQADHQATHQTLVNTLLNGLILRQGSLRQAQGERSSTVPPEPVVQSFDKLTTHHERGSDHPEPVEGSALNAVCSELVEEHFDTLFTTEDSIDQLKQTILQLAVMGKLAPQNPKDEPASVLLEKIAKEKAKLIEEGKIKKQKTLPEITEDEKPFGLPEGWEWVRLGIVTTIRGGKRVANGYKLLTTPTPYIYIRVSDMKNGSIDDSDLHYIDENMHSKISQYIITKDDLYMTIVGATIGKCGFVPEMFDGMNLTENAARVTPYYSDRFFLLKCLESSFCQSQFFDKTKQVGVQKMALGRLSSTFIPIPPLAEQHRIVTKVNQFLSLCDTLKANLNQAQTTQTQLADAIVKQAVN